MAQPTPQQQQQQLTTSTNATNIITALGAAFKNQTGDPLSGEKIAQLLLQNMPQLGELCKQGKLNQAQIMQVRGPPVMASGSRRLTRPLGSLQLKEYADKHKSTGAQVSTVYCADAGG